MFLEALKRLALDLSIALRQACPESEQPHLDRMQRWYYNKGSHPAAAFPLLQAVLEKRNEGVILNQLRAFESWTSGPADLNNHTRSREEALDLLSMGKFPSLEPGTEIGQQEATVPTVVSPASETGLQVKDLIVVLEKAYKDG
jgi:hypothetical protein